MSSSVHIACKEKDILIFDKGPIQGLDDTTLTTEAQYSINLSRSKRKFCFSLQYNESNRFFICYCYKNISIQSKDSDIKKYPLCLANILGRFSASK